MAYFTLINLPAKPSLSACPFQGPVFEVDVLICHFAALFLLGKAIVVAESSLRFGAFQRVRGGLYVSGTRSESKPL